MAMEGAAALIEVFNGLDVFMLAFVRVLGFLIVMPMFSGQTIPMMARLGFAFCFALLALLTGNIAVPAAADGLMDYFLVAVSEFFTGFLVGFTVYMMFAVFYFVGQLADYQIGFSMVSVMDPLNQMQAPITGNLYYFVYLTFFIINGGMNIVLYLFFQTYAVIPAGQAFIIGNQGLVSFMVGLMANYFALGFQIAMPFIAAIFVIDVALGVLVKAVPQMNVFVVGMPLKIGVGLLTLYLMTPVMESFVYTPFVQNLTQYVADVIRGMIA